MLRHSTNVMLQDSSYGNAYEVLSDIHKYFSFDNHICSLLPMTFYVYLVL